MRLGGSDHKYVSFCLALAGVALRFSSDRFRLDSGTNTGPIPWEIPSPEMPDAFSTYLYNLFRHSQISRTKPADEEACLCRGRRLSRRSFRWCPAHLRMHWVGGHVFPRGPRVAQIHLTQAYPPRRGSRIPPASTGQVAGRLYCRCGAVGSRWHFKARYFNSEDVVRRRHVASTEWIIRFGDFSHHRRFCPCLAGTHRTSKKRMTAYLQCWWKIKLINWI